MKKYYNKIKLFNLQNKANFSDFFKEKSYNKIMRKSINKKNIINIQNFFIFLVENYSKYQYKKKVIKTDIKNIKKIISLFFIVKFESKIFTNKTEFNEPLYNVSKQIFILLKKPGLLNWLKIVNLLGDYEFKYNLWSILDKRVNTYGILQLYHTNIKNKLNLSEDSHDYNKLISSINLEQQELESCISYMNDKNELNFFNAFKDNVDFSNTISEKLYFIEVKYKLSKTPPDKLVFVELVEKTNFLLRQCIPNRKDIHKEINQKIDTQLIKQYIKNDIYDKNYFFTIINVIIDYIKQFQAADKDESLDKFKTECYNKLQNNEFYRLFIPMFFMEVFKRLNEIIDLRNKFIEKLRK